MGGRNLTAESAASEGAQGTGSEVEYPELEQGATIWDVGVPSTVFYAKCQPPGSWFLMDMLN